MYQVTVPFIVDNGHFNKEKALAELKRAKADRVGIAISRCFNPFYGSAEKMAFIKELVDYFRQNGFEILIWIGETMGHCPTNDPWALERYTMLRHLNGVETGNFCPLDKHFESDMCDWVREVGKCAPDMILIDDDFRLTNRGHGLACCCDKHMALICEELGETVTVDQLRDKILQSGKNKYRDAWIKVQGDVIRDYSKALRAALNEIDPTIRMGWCNSSDSWDHCGIDVIERANALAGDTKPFVRTCGAPYWVANWRHHKRRYFFGETIEFARLQCSWLKGSGIETMSEGDTYPRPRTDCPAAYLECYDMILRADGSHDGILKYALDYTSDADYETGYIDMQVENEPLYGEIHRLFGGKKAVGFRPYIVPRTFEYRDTDPANPTEDDDISYDMYSASNRMATLASLPITYEDGAINIVFGEHAKYIPEKDLNSGAVIDVNAARFLMDRGIDVGFARLEPPKTVVRDEYEIAQDQFSAVDELAAVWDYDAKDGAKLLSKFRLYSSDNEQTVPDSKLINGVFTYENANGQRFLVLPFDGEYLYDRRGWLDSYIRRRQLVQTIEWLGKKPLDAFVTENYVQLYMLVKKNETSLSVGLWNLNQDRISKPVIHVNTDSIDIEFVNCNGHREGDCIVLDAPLYPYEFAAFEIKL